jgi:hypothetical protein
MKRKLNRVQAQELVDEYLAWKAGDVEHESAEALAEKYGLSRQTMYDYLNKADAVASGRLSNAPVSVDVRLRPETAEQSARVIQALLETVALQATRIHDLELALAGARRD